MVNFMISAGFTEAQASEYARFSAKKALERFGVTYLSAVSSSSKTYHSELMGWDETGLYLAPWNLSGVNVCPNGQHCHERCLNGSGHVKIDALSNKSLILRARIARTQAFLRDRQAFMSVLTGEIARHDARAKSKGHGHFVRLNCTSDISPLAFRLYGKSVLDLFPEVQFIDYTKVPSRIGLCKAHPNYDLTFSYDGHNWDDCLRALDGGVRAAVVGVGPMPKLFDGVPLVSGDLSDIRHLDPKDCVVWLKYKTVANDYKSGKFVAPDEPFVVKEGDPRLVY